MNQWSFDHVAGKLREALHNHIRLAKAPTSGPSRTALNTIANKTNSSRYNGPPCTHPNCRRPKSHATEDCWTKEKEKREKEKGRKHKAKKGLTLGKLSISNKAFIIPLLSSFLGQPLPMT